MKRLLGIVVISLLSITTLGGCGSDASSEAVVITTTTPPASSTLDPSSDIGVIGPVQFVVQKSSSDTTPVPHVKIRLFGGGAGTAAYTSPTSTPPGAMGFLWKDNNRSILAGDGSEWDTETDDTGAVEVFLGGTTVACGSATTNINASLGVTAVISSSSMPFDFTFSIQCS